MGVMILGSLMCFGILNEFKYFNPIRMMVTLMCMALFFNMVFRDSAKHREYFFYSYIAFQISSIFFAYWQFYQVMEEQDMVAKTCEDMQKKDQFKNMKIGSMEECYEVVNNYADKAVMTFIFVAVIIATHFILVVYTHWKNYGRQEFSEQVDDEGNKEAGENEQV